MSCENKELQIVWKNITIQKVATKQKKFLTNRTTHDKISELSRLRRWTDRTKPIEKTFKKMKKVLDKTDLIRYNKQAVTENDTKNIDNWTVK